jgi:hypothetical protein
VPETVKVCGGCAVCAAAAEIANKSPQMGNQNRLEMAITIS